jgi:hypothetical protein
VQFDVLMYSIVLVQYDAQLVRDMYSPFYDNVKHI